jgi:hypothetical protein
MVYCVCLREQQASYERLLRSHLLQLHYLQLFSLVLPPAVDFAEVVVPAAVAAVAAEFVVVEQVRRQSLPQEDQLQFLLQRQQRLL